MKLKMKKRIAMTPLFTLFGFIIYYGAWLVERELQIGWIFSTLVSIGVFLIILGFVLLTAWAFDDI